MCQVRVHLWLRDFDQTVALAARVPWQFTCLAEYSHKLPGQFNELYATTWGNTHCIDWTVRNGESPARGNVEMGVSLSYCAPKTFCVLVRTVFVPVTRIFPWCRACIPVKRAAERSILIAAGVEAALIRVEGPIRSGQTSAIDLTCVRTAVSGSC